MTCSVYQMNLRAPLGTHLRQSSRTHILLAAASRRVGGAHSRPSSVFVKVFVKVLIKTFVKAFIKASLNSFTHAYIHIYIYIYG